MGVFQEGEGCNVLLPLPLLGGALCYFLSTRTESRLVSNDKICLFFATRQAIQFRKRNMNGEFALTATPSFCVVHNAKTSNIANRRRKRAKGFPLGTPNFQRRAFKARRGNIMLKNDTREGQTTPLSLCVWELIIFLLC